MSRRPPRSTRFPYTTLFRSQSSTVGSGAGILTPVGDADIAKRLKDRQGRRSTRAGFAAADFAIDGLVQGLQELRSVARGAGRSEEHTSELQSQFQIVCRLPL